MPLALSSSLVLFVNRVYSVAKCQKRASKSQMSGWSTTGSTLPCWGCSEPWLFKWKYRDKCICWDPLAPGIQAMMEWGLWSISWLLIKTLDAFDKNELAFKNSHGGNSHIPQDSAWINHFFRTVTYHSSSIQHLYIFYCQYFQVPFFGLVNAQRNCKMHLYTQLLRETSSGPILSCV